MDINVKKKIIKISKIDVLQRRFLDVGVRLKQLRGVMSQKEFSKKTGVPVPSYQRYEAGERLPKGPVLLKIAQKTFVTPEWILTGDYRSIEKMDDENIRALATGYRLLEEVIKAIRSIDKRLPLTFIAEILDVDPDNPSNRLSHPTGFYLAIMYLVEIFREGDPDKVKAVLSQLEALKPKFTTGKIKEDLKK